MAVATRTELFNWQLHKASSSHMHQTVHIGNRNRAWWKILLHLLNRWQTKLVGASTTCCCVAHKFGEQQVLVYIISLL